MRWMNKQIRRLKRFVALSPRLFSPPSRIRPVLAELCRIALFHGLEGVKAYLRRVESPECDKTQEETTIVRESVASVRRRCVGTTVPGYVIVAPDYITNSAGIGCLYRLCHELNQRGFPSFMTGSHCTTPALSAPLIDWREGKHVCEEGFIAVYAETIDGNPLGARHVARWVLNRPGLLGGSDVYDDSEMVFNYGNAYEPYIKNRIDGKLHMPTIDQQIFFCDEHEHTPRGLACFYIGKSTWKDGFINRSKVFEITRDTPPRKELGKLFRASRVLYCFDNSTILAYEAVLCGCPAVIIPDGSQTREDYERLELGMDGIAWGLDEEELARATINPPELRERYDKLRADFQTQLAHFIAITQRRACWPQTRAAA